MALIIVVESVISSSLLSAATEANVLLVNLSKFEIRLESTSAANLRRPSLRVKRRFFDDSSLLENSLKFLSSSCRSLADSTFSVSGVWLGSLRSSWTRWSIRLLVSWKKAEIFWRSAKFWLRRSLSPICAPKRWEAWEIWAAPSAAAMEAVAGSASGPIGIGRGISRRRILRGGAITGSRLSV